MAFCTVRLSNHHIEQQITQCVKEIGHQLPEVEDENNLKRTILYIHTIVFDSRGLGVFKLDFNGIGINRYHVLSDKGQEALSKIDEHAGETISLISREIVNKMDWKQQIITVDHTETHKRILANGIIEVFNNPTEIIKDLINRCQISQVFQIENGTSCVITFKHRENFNLDTIFNSIKL